MNEILPLIPNSFLQTSVRFISSKALSWSMLDFLRKLPRYLSSCLILLTSRISNRSVLSVSARNGNCGGTHRSIYYVALGLGSTWGEKQQMVEIQLTSVQIQVKYLFIDDHHTSFHQKSKSSTDPDSNTIRYDVTRVNPVSR